MTAKPSILITGVAGFIGFHLGQRLLDFGYNIIGIDNMNTYYDGWLKESRLSRLRKNSNFLFKKMDIADKKSVDQLFKEHDPQIVIHLAAQAGVRYSIDHPATYGESNLKGFLNILEGCRQSRNLKHFLFASSSSVYGENKKIPFSETDRVDEPASLYAATKKANEAMAYSYAHLYGIPTTGLRFFTVYGPWGRPDMAYYKFTKALYEGRKIQLYNKGQMVRDFTYIDDITYGISNLLDALPENSNQITPYAVYNIGNNRPEKLMNMVQILENLTGITANTELLPMQLGDVRQTYADISALNSKIGFQPKTTLEQGLSHFVNWYKAFCLKTKTNKAD